MRKRMGASGWGRAVAIGVLALGTAVGMARPVVAAPVRQEAQDKAADVDKKFEAANKLLEEKRYAEALTHYKTLLATQPDDKAVLWNAGLAASLSKDYAAALPLWKHLKELDPTNGRIGAKLVQVYQATGDRKARAEERKALVMLRKSGKDPDLAKKPSFCCEMFTVNGVDVYAYDFFALTGKFARRYDFLVLKPDGALDYRLTLESDEADNSLARELHQIKPNERIFTLDGYYGETHKTFKFYTHEISYEEARADVVSVIEGKIKKQSSSTRPATPDKSKKPAPRPK